MTMNKAFNIALVPKYKLFCVFIYSQHWVLKPPSVRGVEVAKASAAARGSGYSDQVVAKARVWV